MVPDFFTEWWFIILMLAALLYLLGCLAVPLMLGLVLWRTLLGERPDEED